MFCSLNRILPSFFGCRLDKFYGYSKSHFSTKKDKKVIPHPDVLKFIASSEIKDKVSFLNPKFLEKKKINPDALCLIDSSAAAKISDLIKDDLTNGSPIFECNPGFCFLSTELIKAGFSDIRLFETDSHFKTIAFDLENRYPEKIKVYSSNIINLWKITFKDVVENGKFFKNIMKGVEKKPWDDHPIINFIGATSNPSFIRDLVYSVVFKSGFLSFGRPDFYLLVTPKLFLTIRDCYKVDHYKRKPYSVLLSIMFDINFYSTFDRELFLPWKSERSKVSFETTYNIESDKMFLVKLSPKKELNSVLPDDMLKPFWFFLKHHMIGKKHRILPMMEEWVPGCGPRLIALGVQVFTCISELTSEQFLTIFKDFSKWPEFESCPFLPAMENYFLKMESVLDIDSSEPLETSEINEET